MSVDVRWGKRARRDLDEIDDHYAKFDRELANEIGRRVFAASRFLAETPLAGARFDTGSRHKWSVRNTPYVLIYRPHADHITILRVRHNRSDWRPKK